jgi:hypothetical protein
MGELGITFRVRRTRRLIEPSISLIKVRRVNTSEKLVDKCNYRKDDDELMVIMMIMGT